MTSRSRTDNMALVRSIKTGGAGSLVRAITGTDMSAALPLAVLKSIYLTLRSPNEPEEKRIINGDENAHAKEQVDGEEPIMKVVKVAVKPPKNPGSLADESVNWEKSSKKWQSRLASQTAFITKEVLYDEWRKHYAKDKAGKYRGLEAPAEDCLLIPEDEIKWRSAPAKTEIDSILQEKEEVEDIQPLRRSATTPEHSGLGLGSGSSSHTKPEMTEISKLPIQKEEAVFIESDGHVAVQDIETPVYEQPSQASQASQASPDITSSPGASQAPADPASPKGKKTFGIRFAKLRRSSTVADTSH